MKYYSINKKSPAVNFKDATLLGQAPDKGLYFPEHIPKADATFISSIENYSNEEIAYRIIQPYIEDSIPEDELMRIVHETVNFKIPLVPVSENISSLELFHGPTLAFKDVGARFMSRCLGYFVKEKKEKVIVLVATSGDTGGAVANGFYNVKGVEVVILFPSGKVSNIQEKQLTTLGNNIHSLEVAGTFDDCQHLVKQAFADKELNKKIFLTSANSINVARWLPQQFYYFYAWKQWSDKNNPPVISVPSGNFGNICAGLVAYKSGLPVNHFIAACNANDTVPEFLKTKKYEPRKAKPTLSNAMDVGNPSNFVRVLELFLHDTDHLQKIFNCVSVTDEQTINTIKESINYYRYMPDPHGAVALLALQEFLLKHPEKKGIFLETAHPSKFNEVMESITGTRIPLSDAVKYLKNKKSRSLLIKNNYATIKELLSEMFNK